MHTQNQATERNLVEAGNIFTLIMLLCHILQLVINPISPLLNSFHFTFTSADEFGSMLQPEVTEVTEFMCLTFQIWKKAV